MNTQRFTCRISNVEKLSDHISSIELHTEGAPFECLAPGAHLDVLLKDNLMRQYSIYSYSADHKTCRIAVKREDQGRGGSLQMHQLDEHNLLTLSQPRNNFALQDGLPHYTLIAGGIGVTPIFSMAHQLKLSGHKVTVFYLVKSSVDAAFANLLNDLDLGDNLHIHSTQESGRIDFNLSFAHLPSETVIYTCGPESMMRAVEQAAESAHIKVHLERFSALPIDTGQDNNFQVEISSTGAVYTIEEGDSIIDVLLEEGVEVDYSCLEGVCGACITAVIEGSIEHRDSILSEKEQVSNKVMCVCVSRASSAKLVLDL